MTDRDHGIRSRSDADQIEAERRRLNDAVRDGARGRIHYDQDPSAFLPALAELADPLNAQLPPRPTADDPATLEQATAGLPIRPLPDNAKAALDADLVATARALRAGQLRSEDLVEAALARVAERNPALAAFVAVRAEAALAPARRLDQEAARGEWRGPLHGMVLAHKDCLSRPGEPMRVGSKVDGPRSGPLPAEILNRLDAAGAIDLGSLNLNEMVAGPTGQNPWFDDCRNAHDPARISGGSSSGSATAVAARLVHGSFGSDTGGSIRLPASMNGLIGLKPTYGRISRAGSFPRAWSLDCLGPLTRTAADAALLLQATAGADPRDPTALAVAVPDYAGALATAAAGSRIALLQTDVAYHADIAQALDRFSQIVSGSFTLREPLTVPLLSACYAMADTISKVEAATLHGEWMRTQPDHYSQAVYSRTEPGLHILAVRYLETLAARASLLRDVVATAFADADILALPTVPIPVPTRVEADMEAHGRVFSVVPALTSLTRPFSYLGLPVLTLPIGRDGNGLPIGVQLVGRPFAEARLLSVAHQLLPTLASPFNDFAHQP